MGFPLTGVRSFVDLEVLGAREHFSTTGKRTLERPFAGVDADVVDQLVLGFEGPPVARTAQPAAGVVGLFRATHVLDGQVDDGFLDTGERATARPRRLLLDVGR